MNRQKIQILEDKKNFLTEDKNKALEKFEQDFGK